MFNPKMAGDEGGEGGGGGGVNLTPLPVVFQKMHLLKRG